MRKGINEIIKDEAKQQKRRFLVILLSTLSASLLRNMLAGKGVIKAGEEAIVTSQRLVKIWDGQDFQCASYFNSFWNLKVFMKWAQIEWCLFKK